MGMKIGSMGSAVKRRVYSFIFFGPSIVQARGYGDGIGAMEIR